MRRSPESAKQAVSRSSDPRRRAIYRPAGIAVNSLDLAAGRFETFDTMEEFLASLE